jgi:hypothetical protein
LGIWSPGPAIVLVEVAGFGESQFAPPIVAAIDRAFQSGKQLKLFIDGEGMENYDSSLRTELTSHLLSGRANIGALVVLAKSRLVTMGVSVANLALGGIIRLCNDRPKFTSALQDELRQSGVVGFSVGVLLATARTVR